MVLFELWLMFVWFNELNSFILILVMFVSMFFFFNLFINKCEVCIGLIVWDDDGLILILNILNVLIIICYLFFY